MNITYVHGNLFTVAKDYGCDAIAHGCNVDGVMGAGIAKTFREIFPYNYEYYKEICDGAKRSGLSITGSYFGFKDMDSGRAIYNLFTQDRPGPYARLEWIQESFTELCDMDNLMRPKVLGIPKIGCGIGGLKWEDVSMVLEHIKSDTELIVASI